MKISINQEFIRRRATIARWSSLVGLGVLAIGLIVSFNQAYYYWSLPALVIGFILASVSAFNANRYVKEPRPDQALAKVLRGFDSTYHLFIFTAPIPHVLLTPARVYALVVKPQDGVIRRQGKRWQRDFSLRRLFLFFGEEGLGNPARDAQAEAERLRRELVKAFSEEAPPVEAIAVFTNPNARLELPESAPGEVNGAPVLAGKDLKKYLRALPKGQSFNSDLRRRLTAFLQGSAAVHEETE
jgi:hypothetical protein